ncbi:MAG: hypothetical protein ACKO96_39615, partial [Flammeovirgaceae bacterium]
RALNVFPKLNPEPTKAVAVFTERETRAAWAIAKPTPDKPAVVSILAQYPPVKYAVTNATTPITNPLKD